MPGKEGAVWAQGASFTPTLEGGSPHVPGTRVRFEMWQGEWAST